MFVPQAGRLGGFLQEKKSGALSSPLKKLCLFVRRKELRMLARRLGAFAKRSLRPVTGGGEGYWGAWGPGQVEECAAPASLLPVPSWIRGVELIGVLGEPAAPWLRCG